MKCNFCNKRKAERECPALGYSICPKCCGENRGTKIDCPPGCRYFRKHEKYQQKKEAEPYGKEAAEKLKEILEEEDRQLITLISTIESLIYYYYSREEEEKLSDSEILEGLKKLKKRLGPIEVPGGETKLGKFLRKEIKSLRERSGASEEKIIQAIDILTDLGNSFSDGNRRLTQGMIGHVKENYDLPDEPEEDEEGLITKPSDLDKSPEGTFGEGKGGRGNIVSG